jgi:tryptophan synthase beta chain
MKIQRNYGTFGGQFVPETLVPALEELEQGFKKAIKDTFFQRRLEELLQNYSGRPTPLFHAKRFSEQFNHLHVFLKREDLNHTGSHKINNTLGQALLAQQLGKTRVIAETGAGQHGVATATACALIGIPCEIYMGTKDMQRQAYNVERMEALGATVQPVRYGSATLKEAVNEALKEYEARFQDTHYLLGSVVGPHPFPSIVAHFQSVIGREAQGQFFNKTGKNPDYAIACVGGGSNASGLFSGFVETNTQLIGVEAGGKGKEVGKNAASISHGNEGVLHGMKSYFVQDHIGQMVETHSIAAGLDYPGIGPVHAFLHETKRARYDTVTDKEAVNAFFSLSTREGIIPALESSHALAYCSKLDRQVSGKKNVLICLSGRGDKDVDHIKQV